MKEAVIDGCKIMIVPADAGTTNQVAAISVQQASFDVTITNCEFTVGTPSGNQYTSAIMVWNGNTITIKDNQATGFARFANIDGSKNIVIKDNTSTDMVGPLTIKGEQKGGMMVQLASTQKNGSGDRVIESVAIENNKILGSNKDAIVPVQNHESSGANSCYTIKDYSNDMDFKMNGSMKVLGQLTVSAGTTFTAESGTSLVIDDGATFNVDKDAEIVVSGAVSGKIENNGTIVAGPGADLSKSDVSGTGSIVSDRDVSEMKEAYLGGDVVGATFDANQKVIVDKNTNITSGDLTIKGVLIVKEGVTLTISADAHLNILNNADVRIFGILVVEEADDDAETNEGTLLVEFGTISISGRADIRGAASIGNHGTLSILQGSDVSVSGSIESTGKVVIADSATLTVTGASTVSMYDVSAGGKLVFDSDVVSGDNTVLLEAGAAVTIDSIVLKDGTKFTVKDEGMFTYDSIKDEWSQTSGTENEITLTAGTAVEEGVVVKEGAELRALFSGFSVIDSVDETKTTLKSKMAVAGDMAIDGIYSPAGIDDESEIDVIATMTIGINTSFGKVVFGDVSIDDGIDVTVYGTSVVEGDIAVAGALFNNSDMTVLGTITATAKDSSFSNASQVTVSGKGAIYTAVELTGDKNLGIINAAYYTPGKDAHYYVTVDSALAAAVAGTTKSIKILGNQTVTATAELPAGVTLTISGKLAVGTDDDAGADVVLTIASGATVKASDIDDETLVVNGTLVAVKKTDIAQDLRSKIASDVKSEETKDGTPVGKGWAKWTNIYTALENAQAGETVTLQRSITLRSVAVPADVTLDVNGKTLTVPQKVTLTVNGTLDLTDDGSKVVLEYSKKDDKKDKTTEGAVIVEGYIVYTGEIDEIPVHEHEKGVEGESSDIVTLPGAYYSVTASGRTTNYLTSYFNGIADANKADGKGYDIHLLFFIGKDDKIELGDVAVTGEADKPVVIIVDDSDLIVGTVTLTDAFIIATCDDDEDLHKTSGTFANANGSVSVIGGIDDFIMVGSMDHDGTQTLVVFGDIVDLGANVVTSVTLDGTVYLDIAYFEVDKTIVNGKVIIDSIIDIGSDTRTYTEVLIYDCAVSGTITIGEGSEFYVAGTLDVEGSIVLGKNAKLTAGFTDELNAEYATTINGSVDASAENAKAKFAFLFIGVAPSIVGAGYDEISVGEIGADASVVGDVDVGKYAVAAPGATVPEVFKDATKFRSTEFSKDGSAYMTVYVKSANSIAIDEFETSKDEALFDGWYYTDSDGKEQPVSSADKIGDYAAVHAKFIIGIYSVTINADAGVAYITIDGKLMDNNGRTFTISGLAAGRHTIAISGVSGYDVSKTALYFPDGKAVGSLDINLANGVASFDKNGKVVYADVVYQLYGSEVATPDTPEPTPIIIKDDKDTSLTDTLLIVLVVLIVIMAILVALRMMRS